MIVGSLINDFFVVKLLWRTCKLIGGCWVIMCSTSCHSYVESILIKKVQISHPILSFMMYEHSLYHFTLYWTYFIQHHINPHLHDTPHHISTPSISQPSIPSAIATMDRLAFPFHDPYFSFSLSLPSCQRLWVNN